MNTAITPDTINDAYQTAQDARRVFAHAGVIALTAKDALKKAQASIAMQGKLEGMKNEMMRESALREWCATEHALMLGAESDEMTARGEYEAATLETARIEALLRLLEIEARSHVTLNDEPVGYGPSPYDPH